MNRYFLIYLLCINVFAFAVWGLDKGLAQLVQTTGGRRDQGGKSPIYRIPEKWLLTLAFLGGCWGCWLAVFLFRHKLRKPGVLRPLIGASILHLLILAFFAYSYFL